VDKEGMRKGFDVELMRKVTEAVDVPVIASGGMGSLQDAADVILNGGADAVAMAHVLHFNNITLADLRSYLGDRQIEVTNHGDIASV